jgi:hypothetical protein
MHKAGAAPNAALQCVRTCHIEGQCRIVGALRFQGNAGLDENPELRPRLGAGGRCGRRAAHDITQSDVGVGGGANGGQVNGSSGGAAGGRRAGVCRSRAGGAGIRAVKGPTAAALDGLVGGCEWGSRGVGGGQGGERRVGRRGWLQLGHQPAAWRSTCLVAGLPLAASKTASAGQSCRQRRSAENCKDHGGGAGGDFFCSEGGTGDSLVRLKIAGMSSYVHF